MVDGFLGQGAGGGCQVAMEGQPGIFGEHGQHCGLGRLQQGNGAAGAGESLQVDDLRDSGRIDRLEGGNHWGRQGVDAEGGRQGGGHFDNIATVEHEFRSLLQVV